MQMRACNLVILGEPGSGKTALIHRLVHNIFEPKYKPTMGANVWKKEYPAYDMVFYIWDVQGVHIPEQILKTYTQNADAYLLVGDATRRRTYSSIEFYWATKIVPKKPVVIIGNKTDVVKNQVIHAKYLFRLEQKLRAKGVFVGYSTIASAKTGFRVNKILQKVGELCLRT